MKILLTLCIYLLSFNLYAAKAKVTDIKFEDKGKEGRLIIKLDKKVDDFPELLVKNNFVQVAIPESFVWPKIDKKFTYQRSFDSKIMAYQFDKNLVRVRAILPERMEGHKDNVSLQLKGKTIVVNFPKKKTMRTTSVSKGRSPALAPKSRKALESKDPSVYDESYLEKLLKQKESAVELKPAAQKKAEGKKLEKDTIQFQQAATKKETSGFSITKYAGKFVGFLALVLLLFYGVVNLLKKGAFSKSKLGFLNSTKVVEVLNTTYIAPKRSILMIRAHNQIFLVGSSEKGLHMISELKDTTGLLKEGEKQLSGSNFDSTLGTANEASKEFKLKEFLNASDEPSESSSDDDSIALKAIEKEMAAAKESHKVKFSDQIKSKIKDLKPLQ